MKCIMLFFLLFFMGCYVLQEKNNNHLQPCPENTSSYNRKEILNQIADSLDKKMPDYVRWFNKKIKKNNRFRKVKDRIKPQGFYVEGDYPCPFFVYDLVDTTNRTSCLHYHCIDFLDKHVYSIGFYGAQDMDDRPKHAMVLLDSQKYFFYFIESDGGDRENLLLLVEKNKKIIGNDSLINLVKRRIFNVKEYVD